MYTATLKVMGQSVVAKGDSAREAILALKPKNAKGKGVLTVQNGEQKRERILMPMIVSRLFNTVGLNREVAMKNISILFDGF